MTLKVRLIALIAFAVLALSMLGAVAVISARDSARRLADLYEAELAPVLALNSINASLQATRSRMTGVALDTYSPTGARLKLLDAEKNIAIQWKHFMAAHRAKEESVEVSYRQQIEQIDAYLPQAWRLFGEIYQAAESDDPAQLTELLGDRWADLHLHLIKPVEQLVPIYEQAMAQAYAEGRLAADREERIVWAALVVTLLGLIAGMVWIIRRISRGVQTIHDGLARLAANRYDDPLAVDGGDEIAQMSDALNTAAGHLARDRAEILAMNRQLNAAQNQLIQSEKLASIGQLAAGMAHEINNPVGFVKSNLGTLEKYGDNLLRLLDLYATSDNQLTDRDPQSLAQIQAMRQALDIDYLKEDMPTLLRESKEGLLRVQRLIHDLKDFSQIDEAQWQRVDLNANLDTTLSVIWNEVATHAAVVKHYGALPPVECYAAEINQVFMNLIRNAVQALDAGKAGGIITLSTGHDADWVWIEVADNGKGMSPEVQNRMFEPFFTTQPVGKGTGLGLSVAYAIVSKHGGRIEVDSASGRGTRMRVVLPLRRADPQKTTA